MSDTTLKKVITSSRTSLDVQLDKRGASVYTFQNVFILGNF